MKVAALGSCLSHSTAARLVAHYGCSLVANVAHNRSDYFIDAFIKRSAPVIPVDELITKISFKPEHKKLAIDILRNQQEEYLGTFQVPNSQPFLSLKDGDIDLFILDNFLDVASELVLHKDYTANVPFFMNIGFVDDDPGAFRRTGFLSPESSAINIASIIHFLKLTHANAKFAVLSFQYSTLIERNDHFERARQFSSIINDQLSGTETFCLPSLIVDPFYTMGATDWAHFKPEIYTAIAGLLFLNMTTKIEGGNPKVFQTFEEGSLAEYRQKLLTIP